MDEVTYEQRGQYELEMLDEWCRTVSDTFWDWYRNAPDCFAHCAEETQKRAAKEASEIFRRLIKPCTNVYECRSQTFGLRRVQEFIDEFVNTRVRTMSS